MLVAARNVSCRSDVTGQLLQHFWVSRKKSCNLHLCISGVLFYFMMGFWWISCLKIHRVLSCRAVTRCILMTWEWSDVSPWTQTWKELCCHWAFCLTQASRADETKKKQQKKNNPEISSFVCNSCSFCNSLCNDCTHQPWAIMDWVRVWNLDDKAHLVM